MSNAGEPHCLFSVSGAGELNKGAGRDAQAVNAGPFLGTASRAAVSRHVTLQRSPSAPSVSLSASRPTVRGQRLQSARAQVQWDLHCRAQRSTVAHRQPPEQSSILPCLADARQAVEDSTIVLG